jgi:site-specific recombinase XerD
LSICELDFVFVYKLHYFGVGIFRATWTQGPRTSLKKLKRLWAFMRFAEKRKWIGDNPAIELKAPKVPNKPK